MVIIEDVPSRVSDEVVLAECEAIGGECVVRLYRRPIELRSEGREELTEIIQGLVVTQIADHFGLDDATLDDLGW
jgi:predicted Zn-dependent protease with MMP-like domain